MISETLAVFLTGATLYGLIELISRGWTHWSMLLAGGICLSLIYKISNHPRLPLWKAMILSTAVITTVEFICGIIFNLHFGLHIWDYSTRPYNLLGQICPAYCLVWLGLSVPGLYCCKALHRLLHQ